VENIVDWITLEAGEGGAEFAGPENAGPRIKIDPFNALGCFQAP